MLAKTLFLRYLSLDSAELADFLVPLPLLNKAFLRILKVATS